MSEQKHTPEPWSVSVSTHSIADTGDYYSSVSIVDHNGKIVPMFDGDDDLIDTENARRVVKCVNACADMDDPAAEIERLRAELAETTTAFWRESKRADKAEADRAALVEALAEIKKIAPKRDARLVYPRWAEIADEALAQHGGPV